MEKKDLVSLRTKLGISQTKLAVLTGVSRFKISQFECGYGGLDESELAKIRRYLCETAASLGEEFRGVAK